MSANVEAMVREGIAAAKAGRKDEARALLSKAVDLNPYHSEGWLWLSGVMESDDDQRTCLENVLTIDPTNQRALQGLDYLKKKKSGGGSSFSQPSFADTAPPPPAPSTGGSVTSVEWDFTAPETSSPSASYRAAPEPSPAVYDDWVSGLGISAAPPPTPQQLAEQMNATSAPPTPFVGFDDEFFQDNNPFNNSAPSAFGDEPATSPFDEPVASNPFDNEPSPSAFGGFDAAIFDDRPPPAPIPPANTIGYRPPPTDFMAMAPVVETAPLTDVKRKSPAIDDGMADLRGDTLDMPAEKKRDARRNKVVDDTPDPNSMFPQIPRSIPITRLPGTIERPPILLRLLAVLLVVANIGAAVLLGMKLLTPA